MRSLRELIDSTIILRDVRSGESYQATIYDAKESYGRLRIQVATANNPWFEPTVQELQTIPERSLLTGQSINDKRTS